MTMFTNTHRLLPFQGRPKPFKPLMVSNHPLSGFSDTGARYNEQATRAALNNDPDFRWCIAPNCNSGQIHRPSSDDSIFRCHECGHEACITHNCDWHYGETCAQLDARANRRRQDDEVSRQLINRISKECPGCTANIEKVDGCDHMVCKLTLSVLPFRFQQPLPRPR